MVVDHTCEGPHVSKYQGLVIDVTYRLNDDSLQLCYSYGTITVALHRISEAQSLLFCGLG